jgi:hypothetical protein
LGNWEGHLFGHLHVGWGDGGGISSSGSSEWGSTGVWGWGGHVWVVEISMIWWVWVVTKTGFGSGSVTGGGVWSSGGWVGVVMRDISWLILEARSTGWSILWSVGSGTWRGNAVDSKWSVVSVTLWEVLTGGVSLVWRNVVLGGNGTDGGEDSVGGEFHFFVNKFIIKINDLSKLKIKPMKNRMVKYYNEI